MYFFNLAAQDTGSHGRTTISLKRNFTPFRAMALMIFPCFGLNNSILTHQAYYAERQPAQLLCSSCLSPTLTWYWIKEARSSRKTEEKKAAEDLCGQNEERTKVGKYYHIHDIKTPSFDRWEQRLWNPFSKLGSQITPSSAFAFSVCCLAC